MSVDESKAKETVQRSPWPTELEDLVSRAACWPGWTFRIEEGDWDEGQTSGLRLIIRVVGLNSFRHDQRRSTDFHYPVPAVSFDRAAWQRWLWDRVLDVHRHETGEAFRFLYERPDSEGRLVDVAEHPFAPFHGPGRDPNRTVEVGVDPMEQRVDQSGGRYPGWWWDGVTVHDDEAHDWCGGGMSCTPVQLVGPSD